MEDMTEFKWSKVVVLLILAWIYINIYIYICMYVCMYVYIFATWKMINPIHITKLKLLYDVELTKWIGGYQEAKHFFLIE